jgi:hypothetical protein
VAGLKRSSTTLAMTTGMATTGLSDPSLSLAGWIGRRRRRRKRGGKEKAAAE